MTTKPFTPDGGQTLVINADASGRDGHVLVELLDADKEPMAKFSRDDCDALNGDKIRHTVTWGGSSDLSTLKGKAVRLRFYLKEAKLFSLKFE